MNNTEYIKSLEERIEKLEKILATINLKNIENANIQNFQNQKGKVKMQNCTINNNEKRFRKPLAFAILCL